MEINEIKPLIFDISDTNEIICEKISGQVKSIPLNKIQEFLAKDFVFQEDAIRMLYVSLITNQNCICFGSGGFGKSVLIKAFLALFKIPIHYKIGHSESTSEDLLGIPNIPKMLSESKIETAFENSMFSKPGVLILEEFLDVNSSVASCLKDILTSRGMHENDTFKGSKIASVIIVGNKSPEELSINDSVKAFYMERFPFQLEMIWKDFTANSYTKFLRVFFKEKFEEKYNEFLVLAELCAATKTLVSPRIAAAGGKVILGLGIDFLDTVTGIDTTDLSKVKSQAKLKACLFKEEMMLNKLTENFNFCMKNIDFREMLIELQLIIDRINDTDFSSDNLIKAGVLQVNVENAIKEKFQELSGIEYSTLVKKYKEI